MHKVNDPIVSVLSEVEYKPGFYHGFKLTAYELDKIVMMVRLQWLKVLKESSPKLFKNCEVLCMEDYHRVSDRLDHSDVWSKKKRILPLYDVKEIKTLPIFKKLKALFGDFLISDEENIGYEEIYWRLVRPGKIADVGFLHADSWFWELGHGTMPKGYKRVKVWIALYCVPGLSGLKVVADSHKKCWRYSGEIRDGILKPRIDEDESQFDIKLLYTTPGDVVIFNDKLLHGGALNNSDKTRVSIEFTMLVRD